MKAFITIAFILLAGCNEKAGEGSVSSIAGKLNTVEHDGHKFVVFAGHNKGGIIHHPGCPCLQR